MRPRIRTSSEAPSGKRHLREQADGFRNARNQDHAHRVVEEIDRVATHWPTQVSGFDSRTLRCPFFAISSQKVARKRSAMALAITGFRLMIA